MVTLCAFCASRISASGVDQPSYCYGLQCAQDVIELKAELAGPLAALQETARYVAAAQRDCKMEINIEEYIQSFKPALMDIIHKWSKVRMAFLCMHGSGWLADMLHG